MNIKSFGTKWLLIATLCVPLMAPMTAQAQHKHSSAYNHRQQTKNEWRNLAIGSGALALIGLIKHDGTLTTLGTIGALYSASRYEHDRKSQSKLDRSRAAIYSHRYVTYNGKKYQRKTVVSKGKKYYRFVRC